MTEPDFAMGTSLVAGTARGLAPLPAFLLGAEAVPLLWVGDGKVASPSLEGGQVAVLRLHAASARPRNEASILLCEGDVCALWHKGRQSTKEAPNFRESPKGEVRRIPCLRSSVCPIVPVRRAYSMGSTSVGTCNYGPAPSLGSGVGL